MVAESATQPKFRVNVEQVPAELRAYAQWICWRYVKRGSDGWDKQPVNPHYPQTAASVTNPATWSTFAHAVDVARMRDLPGIGFVLTHEDPFTAIDLDDVINPKTRRVSPSYNGIVTTLNSYTETSPSGKGVRIFVRGELPEGPRRFASVEMYDDERFVTVTGWHRSNTPMTVNARQTELEGAYRRHIVNKLHKRERVRQETARNTMPRVPRSSALLLLDDEELLERARGAKNGAKFRALFDDGDVARYGGDDSAADLALCKLLAFWVHGDAERIDRLFRQSALYRPKWEREDYRERTIQKVIEP